MASDAPSAAARKPPRHRRLAAVTAIVVLLASCACAAWLFGTPRGAQFALSEASALSHGMMQAETVDGTLSGPLQIGRLTLALRAQRIVLSDVRLDWRPLALLHGRLHVAALRIGRLDVAGKIASARTPAGAPGNIRLPLGLQLDSVTVDGGTVAWGSLPAVALDHAMFRLSYDQRHYHLELQRLDARAAAGPSWQAGLAGTATLADAPPYAMDVTLSGTGRAAPAQRPLDVAGRIHAQGTLDTLRTTVELHAGQAALAGHATLHPSAATLGATQLQLTGLDLAALLPQLPVTALQATLQADANGKGKLIVGNSAAGPLDRQRLPLAALQADFAQTDGRFDVDHIDIGLGSAAQPAGRLTGKGGLAGGALTLELRTASLNLQRLDRRLRATRLAGSLALRHAGGRQEGTLSLKDASHDTPLTLEAHALMADDALTVDRASLRAGNGTITATARLGLGGDQIFNAKGTIHAFRARDLGDFAQLPELLLNGGFTIDGRRRPALQADANFHIDDSRLGRAQATVPLSGTGRIRLDADTLDIAALRIRAGANRFSAQGRLAERGPTDHGAHLTYALDAPALQQLGSAFGGTLQLNGEADGSLRQPRMRVSWKGEHVRAPGAVQVTNTRGKADISLDFDSALRVAAIDLDASADALRVGAQQIASLSVQARLSAAAQAPWAVALEAKGIDASRLRADTFTLGVAGTAARHTLTATLAEHEQNWKLVAAGALLDARRAPRWQGEIRALDASGQVNAALIAPAALLIAQQQIQLDHFRLQADGCLLTIDQFLRKGDTLATRGRFDHLQVGKLLPLLQPQPSVEADLALAGQWNLKLNGRLQGTFSMQRESGDIVMLGSAPVALGLDTLNASLQADHGRANVQLQATGKQLGRIELQLASVLGDGASRFALAPRAPLSGHVLIDTPSLDWLGPLVSPSLVTAGALHGEVSIGGSLDDPRLSGPLAADNLRLLFADTGVDLKQGTLRAAFEGDRLLVQTLAFRNGGTLDIAGPIGMAKQEVALQLSIHAAHYRLLDRVDRKLEISGAGTVGWHGNALQAAGNFTADSGFVDIGAADTPQLSDDVVVVGRDRKQGAKTAVALDLGLDLGKGIKLQGRGLNAQLVGRIRLLADAGGTLRAEGTLRVKSGTFKAYGRELAIEQGLLRFNGALNNPALDIVAMRKNQDVEAGVSVGGTVLAPRITLVSDPTVPDAEKLSWLVLGHGLSSAGGSDLGALQTAASSLLAQGAASGLSSQLATAFGLDDLSVGTSDDTLQERIVTLGKRISSRLYVSYQQGLESASSVLLLRYTLTRRISLEAEAGTRSALSMFYNFAFD